MSDRMLPIAAEGWGFILVPLALAALLTWAGWIKTAIGLAALAAFMAFFFRDPERAAPTTPRAILAPADGKVMAVGPVADDPFVGPAQAVSIFLSPLDVHVNRSPLAGLVVGVEYRPGPKMAAYRAEASDRNERTSISIQADGARVVVRQIAGVLARRIVCRVQPGDRLASGQRFGLIKFGSRTDLIVPATARLQVQAGDRVRGGETVMGLLQ